MLAVLTPVNCVRAVNKNGHLNLPHSHAPVAIAGVYYITSGFRKHDAAGADAGGVYFLKPETSDDDILSDVVRQTKLTADGQAVPPIAPYEGHWTTMKLGRAGTMALWPGRLRHWVPPHTGDEARISIAL